MGRGRWGIAASRFGWWVACHSIHQITAHVCSCAVALLPSVQVGSILRQSPDLSFPLPGSEQAQTWLLTTYLDDDTRITRGDGGSVFILVKDVSLSSPPPPPMSVEQQTAAEAMML